MSDLSLVLPVLPMREDVIFPHMQTPFFIGRSLSVKALEAAMEADHQIFVVTQKQPETDQPTTEDLYEIGTIGEVIQVMRLPNGTIKALFEGKQRARLRQTQINDDIYEALVEPIQEDVSDPEGFEGRFEEVLQLFRDHVQHSEKLANRRSTILEQFKPGEVEAIQFVDRAASSLEFSKEQRLEVLHTTMPLDRLELLSQILGQEEEIRTLEAKLRNKAQQQVESFQKEGYLQDQLKNIQDELGQNDEFRSEIEELEQQLTETPMTEEAKEAARKELKKLRMMSPLSAEATVVRNYIEWLLSIPWNHKTEDQLDLDRAQEILDEDHYGLEKVKERILEYLAVAKLKGHLKGPILCLVGPPGVGKTSLARSVARALGKNFVHLSLGGVRDEAEVRGHRRTYIGALPGKVIQSIKKAKSTNPVMLLDEIDKLAHTTMSDPSAALLEVLDPEQNKNFADHYLDVEYDLSDILFICTANTTQTISGPLLDRMEVIELPGYTELEKIAIAENFIVPKQLKQHGLTPEQIQLKRPAVEEVIQAYTREAGVRNLERELGKICRKVVTEQVKQKEEKPYNITVKMVQRYLGVPLFQHNIKEEENQVGIAVGLGVTSLGGELLFVEVGTMPGKGKLSLTGKLGDVMKESAQAAFSYVRANAKLLHIDAKAFKQNDVHIHLPEGATPKDGPSAGLPLITALVSAFSKVPIRHDVAMTGEITLRGHVKEIGGLKEKLLAAKRAGIQEVVIPADNEKDLDDIPAEIKKSLTIHSVDHIGEALRQGLENGTEIIQENLENIFVFSKEFSEAPSSTEVS